MQTIKDLDDFEARHGWRPGTEPGVDTSRADGGHSTMVKPHAECQITVVDLSVEKINVEELDNQQLIDFLKIPQPDWVQCRWINVNGLSWDVIKAIGQTKKLHRLAVEDLMNTNGRTKADWYQNHAFIVLTLQKLTHLDDGKEKEKEAAHHAPSGPGNLLRRLTMAPPAAEANVENGRARNASTTSQTPLIPRTLHRYHASPNTPRTQFMEERSALLSRHLAVAAEQVSIFLTSDNTVIAFFESSADDVEVPILTRLTSPSTILRQSCDASLLTQAIIDVIVDMAIPVQSAYSDIIGDIEMDVLTLGPDIQQSKDLYILAAEVKKMRSFVQPIENIINTIREHKAPSSYLHLDRDAALRDLRDPEKGVIITPVTAMYLGDVLDHCLLIRDNLWEVTKAADDLIDLIFNTIAAYQNETLKQLTIATIVFLPLTFLTGYFGQNFEPFPELEAGIKLFWQIAAPVVVGTVLLLQREMIYQHLKSLFQRRRISNWRRRVKQKGGPGGRS
ncbi:hypothetical protein QBC34DRAFT_450981 [Podospora aff. communis PSN243]|uniref:Uncharacterized protein n=1 Tax=Podospora aff. communis PSN243 TaxID=3040156 RepID=A0AAV9GFM9_9PEZI|nr:hypothetical protein QBC34DRAFT_450981 [Podospora aff. communis PSN243]